MSSSQPIALPVPAHSQDTYFALGSYTSPSGAFNPASYTRHFLGSPLSWRGGSFEGRFYPAGSPDHFVGSLDQFDVKCGKLSSSLESDRGSFVNAFNVYDGDLCRNYTCCGLNLTDLHALLEHFEEVHVVVLDPSAPQQPIPAQYLVANCEQVQLSQQFHAPQPQAQMQTSAAAPAYVPDQHSGPFDPDDMELDLETMASTPSSGVPTPPDTPLSTPLSSYPSPSGYMQSHLPPSAFPSSGTLRSMPASSCASPLPQHQPHIFDPTPIAAFETTVVHAPSVAHRSAPRAPLAGFPPLRTNITPAAPEVFNVYAGYSDYSSRMPGAVPSPPATLPEEPSSQGTALSQRKASPIKVQIGSEPTSPYAGCVPPQLLFSDTRSTPACTPTVSRVPSPSHTPTRDSNKDASSSASTARASSTLSRPATSLLLTTKPYRCPKANCSKSYKQANGLKYHLTHGQCNFTPPKDLEHVQALIASKRSARGAAESGATSPTSPQSPKTSATRGGDATVEQGVDGSSLGLGLISENELREAEREAERQLRPFACGIGDCQRRYKNMNGLRYHYQHSGEHGAHGLALLANGLHQCLGLTKGSSSNAGSAQSSRHASRQGSRERERGRDKSSSGVSTPVQQQQVQPPPHPHQYNQQQQQPYGTYTAQQQIQLTYQQQYAQHQRLQYQQQQQAHAQAQTQTQASLSSTGMYIGVDYAMSE